MEGGQVDLGPEEEDTLQLQPWDRGAHDTN